MQMSTMIVLICKTNLPNRMTYLGGSRASARG